MSSIARVCYKIYSFYIEITAPSKRHIPARIEEEPGRSGEFRVEFTPTEVGSHLVEVSIAGQKLPAGPLVAKVYNSSLIQVTDVPSAVVGHACQFRGELSIVSCIYCSCQSLSWKLKLYV